MNSTSEVIETDPLHGTGPVAVTAIDAAGTYSPYRMQVWHALRDLAEDMTHGPEHIAIERRGAPGAQTWQVAVLQLGGASVTYAISVTAPGLTARVHAGGIRFPVEPSLVMLIFLGLLSTQHNDPEGLRIRHDKHAVSIEFLGSYPGPRLGFEFGMHRLALPAAP